jgi:hypothetical protein
MTKDRNRLETELVLARRHIAKQEALIGWVELIICSGAPMYYSQKEWDDVMNVVRNWRGEEDDAEQIGIMSMAASASPALRPAAPVPGNTRRPPESVT